ncbi:hypothetical protein MW887_003530 [Aspergillus wentii]|nr:hypothetical protein MW887_003530 [Aspergillus wentii]
MQSSKNEGQRHLVGIVGMACRVPGASNPSELWSVMEEKRDVGRKMPSSRFNVDAFYHPDDQDIGHFDAGFFNISGKEAEAMDPQQRLALEVVYEALENAGIPYSDIAGSQTSVYCGSFTNDYSKLIDRDMQNYPTYTVTGMSVPRSEYELEIRLKFSRRHRTEHHFKPCFLLLRPPWGEHDDRYRVLLIAYLSAYGGAVFEEQKLQYGTSEYQETPG